jgi:hypothetical protein
MEPGATSPEKSSSSSREKDRLLSKSCILLLRCVRKGSSSAESASGEGLERRSAISNWVKVSLGSCFKWHEFGLAYFFQAFEAELFSSLLKLRGRWCDWERGDEGEQGHKGHEDEGAHVARGNDW